MLCFSGDSPLHFLEPVLFAVRCYVCGSTINPLCQQQKWPAGRASTTTTTTTTFLESWINNVRRLKSYRQKTSLTYYVYLSIRCKVIHFDRCFCHYFCKPEMHKYIVQYLYSKRGGSLMFRLRRTNVRVFLEAKNAYTLWGKQSIQAIVCILNVPQCDAFKMFKYCQVLSKNNSLTGRMQRKEISHRPIEDHNYYSFSNSKYTRIVS